MAIWTVAGAVLGVAIAVAMGALLRFGRENSLAGAVLMAHADPRKQLPIPNVEVTAEAGGANAYARSDSSGYFRLRWSAGMWRGEPVTLWFRHPNYQPLEMTAPLTGELYVARMVHSPSAKAAAGAAGPEIPVANLRIRYAVKAATTINLGSEARTFEVVNTGNVPCRGRPPCSPDGKWKAAMGSASLDAGEDREFRNARVSCIAGPCPFTRIDSDRFSGGGRKIAVSVRNWSDTVTFLMEAEVVHTMISDEVRLAYPSIFGREMTFTLPPTGQGPSIEAEVDGTEIVFPLGPDLRLSWASCTLQSAADRTKLYSCELKPGYTF